MNTIPQINSYISNSKTTKFLNKFKSKISVTGSNGVAEILNGNFSDLNSLNKQFSNKDKNQWKESFEECNNFYIVNGYEKEIEKKYPEELRIFKKISLTSSDQKPNFQYQIDNSLKPKKSKESNFYGYTPYNITSFKAKFEGKVVLPRSLGSNVGSDEWNKQFGLRSKLKEFSDKYKTIKIKKRKPDPNQQHEEEKFEILRKSKIFKAKEFSTSLPPLDERKKKEYTYYDYRGVVPPEKTTEEERYKSALKSRKENSRNKLYSSSNKRSIDDDNQVNKQKLHILRNDHESYLQKVIKDIDNRNKLDYFNNENIVDERLNQVSNTNLEFNYKNYRNIYKDKTNENKTLINVNRQDEYNLNKYNIQSKDSSLNNARFISINDMSIDKNNKNLSSLQKLKMSLIK